MLICPSMQNTPFTTGKHRYQGSTGFFSQRDPDPNCQSRTAKRTGRKPQTDHCRTQGGTGTGKTAAKDSFRSPKGAAPVHERPVTAKQPEDFRHHAEKPAMQPASHPSGNGDRFLRGNCGGTGFGSGGKKQLPSTMSKHRQ